MQPSNSNTQFVLVSRKPPKNRFKPIFHFAFLLYIKSFCISTVLVGLGLQVSCMSVYLVFLLWRPITFPLFDFCFGIDIDPVLKSKTH